MLMCPYFGAYVEDIDPEHINAIGGEDWFSNYYDHTNDSKSS